MSTVGAVREALTSPKGTRALQGLYGSRPGVVDRQRERYRTLLERFAATFPADGDLHLFSTPGRTEVGGNHTDHNAGRVLAAAVDLDIVAATAKSGDGRIVIDSEGYPRQEIAIDDLDRRDGERYTADALTRGVAARLRELGHAVGGFHACLASSVPKGSGLSSSAAYEVLIATILNRLYNDGHVGDLEIAMLARYAENEYFGKPCGLMDQTTCAVGGFVTIDFRDAARPKVDRVRYDFGASGYALVIVDTGGSHADLNDDYAAIAGEMRSVARALGGSVLREFSKRRVLAEIARLRTTVSDRAILRALHFYDDDQRVAEEVGALEAGRFDEFLRLVNESGRSSWMRCQNCYSPRNVAEQGISVALAVSETLLAGSGAWRVHGGGFAGTIQAFVPQAKLAVYLEQMRSIFGAASCHDLMIRPVGSTMVELA